VEDSGALGTALPGYEIGTELGRGAFGVVVAGRHRQLGREVAIKQLSPALMSDDVVRQRFLAEARVLASIDHPHVVPIYDYVEQGESCILVMERLGGGTVWHQFVDRGFDQRSACAIALAVCSGLHGAHQHGVLHRDMKPENVLFGSDHSLKVTDFGIARVLGENDVLASRDGQLLGTPAYMAPEQASGTDLGPATDIYAVGVMLYELLSGQLPFSEDGGSMAIVMRHINEDPTPLLDAAPTVPIGIANAVMQALSRAPEDRFASAEDFGAAIGAAASVAWGSNWIDLTGITLRDSGRIVVSARSSQAVASESGSGHIVRPAIEVHTGAGTDLALEDLMPLRQNKADIPDYPKRMVWISVVLAAAALVFGLFGLASPSPHTQLPPGQVSINGHDPATSGSVPLNLDRNIPIVVHHLPAVGRPVTAQLLLSFGGIKAVRSTTVPLVRQSGVWSGQVDASVGRYIVGGQLVATLRLNGPHQVVTDDFTAALSRSPFGTFLGLVGLVLLLVVVAYAESLLRGLRRGYRRNRRMSLAGLVLIGLLGGVTAGFWGWMLGLTSPTVVGFAIPAVIGAAAGVVVGQAAVQIGQRARAHRLSNRLVLVARRSPPKPAVPMDPAVPVGGA
jgi:serine/threonine protein kinase